MKTTSMMNTMMSNMMMQGDAMQMHTTAMRMCAAIMQIRQKMKPLRYPVRL